MKYSYKGIDECDSVCDLEIKGKAIILTELDENMGTSVTNCIEDLATEIANELNIDKKEMICISHFFLYGGIEVYQLITFDIEDNAFVHPNWQEIPKAYVDKLCK